MGTRLDGGRVTIVVSARLARLLRLFSYARKYWWAMVMVLIVVLATTTIGTEYTTSHPSFCGSCHIMTNYHQQWKKSKHAEEGVTCVDCHYKPGEQHTLKAKFKGMGQLFSYLGSESRMVEKAALVNDASCVRCHPTDETAKEVANLAPGEEFWLTKTIPFMTYKREDGKERTVTFVHKTHFDQKNWEEGQEKHCSICHRHQSGDRHVEVRADTCNLCHFKNVKLNNEQSKCSLCHDMPKRPFKEGAPKDAKAITHQILEERGVSCEGCHKQHVRGTGGVRTAGCLECHENNEELMGRAQDKKYMHETHVAAQTAHCFSCHERIAHGGTPEGYNHYNASLNDCTQCHIIPHRNKVLLLSGTGGEGVDRPLPIEHHNVSMNCQACHIVAATDAKGRPKKLATATVCIGCHEEKDGALIKKWKDDVAEILEEARAYETAALKALEKAKGNASDETYINAQKLISDGRKNVYIVNAGGGVHNKKYSALLLDIAIEKFEDAIDQLGDE